MPKSDVTSQSSIPTISRTRKVIPPSVLIIGASTGGPQAITALISNLVSILPRVPVCVTLHMPADMMPIIAAHVTRTCGVEARVVEDTQDLLPGIVYFAPGDRHFHFRRRDAGCVDLSLKVGAPDDACKSAVDAMFASAAACFGGRTLAVVLSGMGQDGLAGAREIVAAGGHVIVQDKASSAVWGMPGAVAKADLASAILPPKGLADEIGRRVLTAASAI